MFEEDRRELTLLAEGAVLEEKGHPLDPHEEDEAVLKAFLVPPHSLCSSRQEVQASLLPQKLVLSDLP